MARVSKRWLKPEVEEKIHRLLVDCILGSRDKNTAANFIDVLLTKTEKLMIGKRIAIALMLIKGNTPLEIDAKLKVSLTTVYTVQAWLEAKGREYSRMLTELSKRDLEQEEEFRDLKSEAQSNWILPPRGVNWKSVKSAQWRKVRQRRVVF